MTSGVKKKGFARGLTNYGDRDFARFLRRSFARSMGISRELLGKPVVGIAMTPSGFNNCHRTMPELVEAVSRGVLAAGALPRPFPTISFPSCCRRIVFRTVRAIRSENAPTSWRRRVRSAAERRGGRRTRWTPSWIRRGITCASPVPIRIVRWSTSG